MDRDFWILFHADYAGLIAIQPLGIVWLVLTGTKLYLIVLEACTSAKIGPAMAWQEKRHKEAPQQNKLYLLPFFAVILYSLPVGVD